MSASIHRSAMDALWEARRAWAKTQDQLDIFSVLNEQPAPALSHGLLVEGGDGPGGESAYDAHASLTAAATWHAHGGCAPLPSLTNQGEAPHDLA